MPPTLTTNLPTPNGAAPSPKISVPAAAQPNPTSRVKDFFAVIGFLTVLAALSFGMVKSTPFILRTGVHAAVSASTAVFFPTKLVVSPEKITLREQVAATISWKITGGNVTATSATSATGTVGVKKTSVAQDMVASALKGMTDSITGEKESAKTKAAPKPLLPPGSLSISYPCVDGIYFMVRDGAAVRPTFCNTLNGLVPATASIQIYPLRSAELVRTSADRTSTSTPIVPVTISYYKNGAKKPLIFDSVFVSVPR